MIRGLESEAGRSCFYTDIFAQACFLVVDGQSQSRNQMGLSMRPRREFLRWKLRACGDC